MDLASRKLELIDKLMSVVNPEKVKKIEQFFEREIVKENELPQIVNQLLKKSEEDSLNNNVLSHENVMQEARERYKLSK